MQQKRVKTNENGENFRTGTFAADDESIKLMKKPSIRASNFSRKPPLDQQNIKQGILKEF